MAYDLVELEKVAGASWLTSISHRGRRWHSRCGSSSAIGSTKRQGSPSLPSHQIVGLKAGRQALISCSRLATCCSKQARDNALLTGLAIKECAVDRNHYTANQPKRAIAARSDGSPPSMPSSSPPGNWRSSDSPAAGSSPTRSPRDFGMPSGAMIGPCRCNHKDTASADRLGHKAGCPTSFVPRSPWRKPSSARSRDATRALIARARLSAPT